MDGLIPELLIGGRINFIISINVRIEDPNHFMDDRNLFTLVMIMEQHRDVQAMELLSELCSSIRHNRLFTWWNNFNEFNPERGKCIEVILI